jgi:hypothetical protein
LVALVAALGQRPVIAQLAPLVHAPQRSWGQIPWHQVQIAVAHLPAEDVQRYHEAVITGLAQYGAAGVVYPIPLGTQEGGLLPVPSWQTSAGQAPSIDAERYLHNPALAFAQLWHDV